MQKLSELSDVEAKVIRVEESMVEVELLGFGKTALVRHVKIASKPLKRFPHSVRTLQVPPYQLVNSRGSTVRKQQEGLAGNLKLHKERVRKSNLVSNKPRTVTMIRCKVKEEKSSPEVLQRQTDPPTSSTTTHCKETKRDPPTTLPLPPPTSSKADEMQALKKKVSPNRLSERARIHVTFELLADGDGK